VIKIATIRDIAKLANVSASTVCRVLNLDQTINVTIETRKRIFEAAEKLSYQKPERDSSNLQQYALVHWYDEIDELNDPFFLSIRLGIERECEINNISLEKYFNSGSNHTFKDIQKKYQGIIVLGKFSKSYLEYFEEHAKNIILVHDFSKEFKFESVIVNFEELTRDVLNTMIMQGHEKIGFICGREKVVGSKDILIDERETTFIDHMIKLNLYDEKFIRIGDFSYSDGYLMMKSIIVDSDILPTSIFIASDSLAIGALRALSDYDIKVPETISIISCNDIPAAEYTTPSLSTVKISTEFMGMLSAQLLINQNQRKEKIRYIIPHKIILRDTFKI